MRISDLKNIIDDYKSEQSSLSRAIHYLFKQKSIIDELDSLVSVFMCQHPENIDVQLNIDEEFALGKIIFQNIACYTE